MESKYKAGSRFSWSFSGFPTQKEAEASLDDIESWFRRTFDSNEWEVGTSIKANAYGFVAELNAVKVSSDV